MAGDLSGSFCQSCLAWNSGERSTCIKCGTKLLIVTGEERWDDPIDEPNEDLEEHFLERITVAEETLRRAESYLESISEQLGKLERAEIILRNGMLALVQEMEQHKQLNVVAFKDRWEDLVDDNLHLISAREVFGRYRTRIIPLTRPKNLPIIKRALLETSGFLEQGDLPGACKRLQQVLLVEPKNYELLFLTASLLESDFQLTEAEGMARKVVSLSPRHFEGWMLLSKLYQEIGDKVEQAMVALNMAADLRPDEADPRLQLATLLEETDDLDGALSASLEAVGRRRDSETLSRLGEIYLSRGDGPRAQEIFQEATSLYPSDSILQERLAESFLLQNERSKSYDILHSLLEKSPKDRSLLLMLDAQNHHQFRSARDGSNLTKALLNEAEDLIEEGSYSLAEPLLKKAKRQQMSDRLEWLEILLQFKKNPNLAHGRAVSFSASEHHPRLCFEALSLSMDYFIKSEQTSDLVEALKGYLQKYPQTSGAWESVLAFKSFLMLNDQIDDRDLEEVRNLYLHPLPGQSARARTLLCQMLLSLKHPEQVPPLLVPIMNLDPSLLDFLQLGTAYAAVGKRKEAIATLREGLSCYSNEFSDKQAQNLKSQMEELLKQLSNSKHSKS
jgi:tetratricopeptide (TPR) repeat protein